MPCKFHLGEQCQQQTSMCQCHLDRRLSQVLHHHQHCHTCCVWCTTSACCASKSATTYNISTNCAIYRICGTMQCNIFARISDSQWCGTCNATSNTGDQLCTFIGCHTTLSSNLLPNSAATTASAVSAEKLWFWSKRKHWNMGLHPPWAISTIWSPECTVSLMFLFWNLPQVENHGWNFESHLA